MLKGTELLTEVVDRLLPRFPQMTLDQLGICLVNKAIVLVFEENQISAIIAILAEHIVATIQSPYGNYAITTALEVRPHNVPLFIDLGLRKMSAHYGQG
jgi:hypothetical protein